MSENENGMGGASDASDASAAAADTSADMAANDIGGFEASISASDPQGALSATETHDTPNAASDPGASGSDLAAAGIAATETSAGAPTGSPGQLDLAAPAAPVAAPAAAPSNDVSLSDLASVALGAAAMAFAASRNFGKAAGAGAATNATVRQGAVNLGNAVVAAAKDVAQVTTQGQTGFLGAFAANMSPADLASPAAPAAPLPVSPDPAFPPAVVAENTHFLMQLGFVPNG